MSVSATVPPLVRFNSLASLPGLVHGITTRQGGISQGPFATLNLSLSVGDQAKAVAENRRRVAAALGSDLRRVLTSRQVHRADVFTWRSTDDPPDPPPVADVLTTDQPGILLMQRFADCVPILLAAEDSSAIALAHAGWRGTLAGAGLAGVQALRDEFGSDPRSLFAAIGPSIGPCCYEVGADVANQFPESVITTYQGRTFLDLWEANRLALVEAGVAEERIENTCVCTRCHADEFFSHRAMGYPAGRFGAAIGLQA